MAEEERQSGVYSQFNTFHSAVLIHMNLLTRTTRRTRIIGFVFQNIPRASYAKNQLKSHRDETKHDFNLQRKSMLGRKLRKLQTSLFCGFCASLYINISRCSLSKDFN